MPNDNKKTLVRKPPKKKSANKKVAVRVTHLEMTHPPLQSLPVPTRPTIALMKAENIPAKFYQYLYRLVGKPHHWEDRRDLSEPELFAIVNDETVEISVLYADGCPAGFFELDKSKQPESIEILYFGLGTDHQGLGLGKWFLSAAISAAWSHKPEKVIVETNTLDHPAALALYQRLGFSPVAVSDSKVLIWD